MVTVMVQAAGLPVRGFRAANRFQFIALQDPENSTANV